MSKLFIFLFFFSLINIIFGKTDNIVNEVDLSKFEKEEYINFFKVPDSLITSTAEQKKVDNYFKRFISFLSINYNEIISNIFWSIFTESIEVNRILINLPSEEKCIPPKENIKLLYSLGDETKQIEEFSYNRLGKKNIIELPNVMEVLTIAVEIKTNSLCSDKIQKSDIEILQPEKGVLNSNIINVFDKKDYRMLTLSKEYNKKEFIANLENESKKYKLTDYAKRYINRIKAVYAGEISYTSRREFVTNVNTKSNILYQRGNIDSYARSTLKMTWAGTNRQSTGIYARSNETITVFVERGNTKDPLPSLRIMQHIGHWINVQGKEIKLKEGEQTIVVDDFEIFKDYTVETFPGGPIYLINPYTSQEQSQNLSVYIEGGTYFPLFRLGDDEKTYRERLTDCIALNHIKKEEFFDLTELVSLRTIMTLKCSDAYNKYVTEGKSPQENLINWDAYLKKLYIFDGIQFDKKLPFYDEKNNYLNINFRHAQPYGAAFSHIEHIGIFDPFWIDQALYLKEEDIGWGYPHEIGHMMDIGERIVGETSNNMISKYSENCIQNEISWGTDIIENKILYLTADDVDPLLRGCKSDDTTTCKGFLTNIPLNFLIFWDLESVYHGYWGRVDNMYRYNNTVSNKLTKEEKFVYFSSVVLGFDLGYYFTRWGLSFSDGNSIFDESKATSEYKELMKKAINENLIDAKTKKKYWYLDYKEYHYMDDIGLGCYQDKDEYDIQIVSLTSPEANNYVLTLPKVKCPGHLGFEIYESGKLIGFTYDYTYTDLTVRSNKNYIPSYSIIAYDRLLDASKESDVREFKRADALKQINLVNPLSEEE